MTPLLFGIVNVTEDSFSDGGRYLEPDAAIEHARDLAASGADVIELGPASSHPDSEAVPPDTQIDRLARTLPAISSLGLPVSVDVTTPEVQHWAIERGISYLNDIRGFPDPGVRERLADSECDLVVMHSVVSGERAGRVDTAPSTIVEVVGRFFEERLALLERSGVERRRIVLDPGMGFFLGTDPMTSIVMLRGMGQIKARFGCRVMVCVSRKSFLRAVSDRDTAGAGPATLAAELFAARDGVDMIRTHDIAALRDGLRVQALLTDRAAQ